MKNITTITLIVLIALFVSGPVVSFAGGPGFKDDTKTWKDNDDDHNDDDDRGDDDWNDDDSNEIPLDGGLSVLAVAGAAYGIKRVRDAKSKK